MKGKSLNNEPEAENRTIKTIEAIGLLYGLDSLFIRKMVTHPVTKRGVEYQKEVSRDYYSEENINELFTRRFNEEKERSRMLSADTFARGEIERVNAKLNQIRNTNSDVDYYTTHDAWRSAEFYIDYLKAGKYNEKRVEGQESPENYNNLGNDAAKVAKQIGRPKKGVKSFNEFLKLTDEERNVVFDVIKDAYNNAGDKGVVLVMRALIDKIYFTMPGVRAELWDSLRQLTGLKTSDPNLNSHYGQGMTQELREEIQRWSNKLP